MPSLAEMLGYIVQPLGGPVIPILPKAQSNATAGGIPGVVPPKGQPLSSPSEMMNALTAIGDRQSEAKLRAAQIQELERLATVRDKLTGSFDDVMKMMAGGGAAVAPAATAAPSAAFGALGGPVITEGRAAIRDPRGVEPLIRSAAMRYGHDPDTAVKVAQSEGLGTFFGDGGKSGTAFQLYTGGGLGNEFQKETGLDPLDPKNEPTAIDWAMRNLDRTGWSPYHGAKRVGVGSREGIAVGAGGGLPAVADFGGMMVGNQGAAPGVSPMALAIARLGALGTLSKLGDVASPLEKAFYNSPAFQAQVAGAKKGGEFPWASREAQLKADLDARNAAIAAETARRNADLLAGRVADPATGAVGPRPGYVQTESASQGAVEEAKAGAARETKRQEQERAAKLDLVLTVVDLPDGSQVERWVPRSIVVGQTTPTVPPQAVVQGAAPGGLPQPAPVTPGPTMMPGGGVIGGKPIGVGPPAEGYRTIVTPGGVRQEMIPGSPQARAAIAQQGGTQQTADIATQEIRRALNLSDFWSTGLVGQVLGGLGGTGARDLVTKLDTVKAITGFEELGRLRAQSPSGGALGPVSEKENTLLQSTKGSLDNSQSREEFEYNLKRLHGLYQDIVHGTPADLEKAVKDGTVSRMQYDQVLARRNKMVDDGSMLKPIDPDTMAEARAAIQRTNNRKEVVKRLMERGFDIGNF